MFRWMKYKVALAFLAMALVWVSHSKSWPMVTPRALAGEFSWEYCNKEWVHTSMGADGSADAPGVVFSAIKTHCPMYRPTVRSQVPVGILLCLQARRSCGRLGSRLQRDTWMYPGAPDQGGHLWLWEIVEGQGQCLAELQRRLEHQTIGDHRMWLLWVRKVFIHVCFQWSHNTLIFTVGTDVEPYQMRARSQGCLRLLGPWHCGLAWGHLW